MSKKRVLEQIKGIVDRETRAWDSLDVNLLLSVFHPDMVWPCSRTAHLHDPMEWVFELGRFDDTRWRRCFEEFFSKRTLVHNQRTIEKIVLSREADGALAVVDIDTLWSDQDDRQHHWWGRVCKGYTNVNGEWKMTMQIGVLKYPG